MSYGGSSCHVAMGKIDYPFCGFSTEQLAIFVVQASCLLMEHHAAKMAAPKCNRLVNGLFKPPYGEKGRMRLIMMGTGPFAEPTFRLLHETHHQIAALVTAPIRPLHGKSKSVVPVNGMRDLAHQYGIEIYDPEDINRPESQERLASYQADLMIVCDYGQILSAETLGAARLGGINLHGSLLPKYRGAAPINWAIYNGETHSGVTVIHMTPRVDAGPCIGQASTPIEPEEDAVQLETRLREIGGWLIRRTVDLLEAGQSELLPQDASLASKAPRLKKSDGAIDWSRTSLQIKNHIRAMEPWP